MNELFVALMVAGAYVLGQHVGHRWAVYRLSAAIKAGRSPQARALRRVLEDPNISAEIDR